MYFYVYCNITFINLKPKYYCSKSIIFFLQKTEHCVSNLEYCLYLIKENILSLYDKNSLLKFYLNISMYDLKKFNGVIRI